MTVSQKIAENIYIELKARNIISMSYATVNREQLIAAFEKIVNKHLNPPAFPYGWPKKDA